MIKPREIERKTMSPAKRATAHNDYFAFYVGRPLSYVLTIPFLYINLSPNMLSLLSMIPLLIAFIVFYVAISKTALIIGWILFFIWNLMDGVDGNVARYKQQYSKLGSVYDAMSGYLAMVFTFFAMGMAATHFNGVLNNWIHFDSEIYIILGALSGVFMIFPRLVMHKAISTLMNPSVVKGVKDKSNFNPVKIFALNLSSVAGGAQVLMLISIILDIMDVYTICYFVFNFLVMVVSLKSILKEK
ncbi:CDP-alcohol phosphatidyltransferase family protein [Clostridium beijerinckii]|uniref:CDP-alcohol phosphatidyltransferase n=1 Tax=Clostridium beijerinckii TaxID=1520 RepID=A0A1S8RV82_CLOBE|nr:CDP-alcohol phosphatidyltransferase family protein [Clostridium beijerinckii]NRY62046.1 phosphatidylglycerophosphate synthase [Clostridium beijerinckii]OOM57078.1 CDP-alcohol phosphatidyltransferase [Clostridium beijerinckii]